MDIFLHIKKRSGRVKKKRINDDEAMSSFRTKIKILYFHRNKTLWAEKINRTTKIKSQRFKMRRHSPRKTMINEYLTVIFLLD